MADVRQIAVLGAGTMGSGIAQVCAQAGFNVAMQDVEERFLRRGFDAIEKSLGAMTRKAKITEEQAAEATGRIRGTLDLADAVGSADMVIEAVPEEIGLKQQVFKRLSEACKPEAVLATNTSTISITAIASATARPDKVIGIHFATPVPLMKGVEVITGLDTSEATSRPQRTSCGGSARSITTGTTVPGLSATGN